MCAKWGQGSAPTHIVSARASLDTWVGNSPSFVDEARHSFAPMPTIRCAISRGFIGHSQGCLLLLGELTGGYCLAPGARLVSHLPQYVITILKGVLMRLIALGYRRLEAAKRSLGIAEAGCRPLQAFSIIALITLQLKLCEGEEASGIVQGILARSQAIQAAEIDCVFTKTYSYRPDRPALLMEIDGPDGGKSIRAVFGEPSASKSDSGAKPLREDDVVKTHFKLSTAGNEWARSFVGIPNKRVVTDAFEAVYTENQGSDILRSLSFRASSTASQTSSGNTQIWLFLASVLFR